MKLFFLADLFAQLMRVSKCTRLNMQVESRIVVSMSTGLCAPTLVQSDFFSFLKSYHPPTVHPLSYFHQVFPQCPPADDARIIVPADLTDFSPQPRLPSSVR